MGLKGNLYFRDEPQNPARLFKDRPTATGVSKAIETGIRTVTIASVVNAISPPKPMRLKGDSITLSFRFIGST